jgi:hypothetical protein
MCNLDICGSEIYKKILNLKFMMMSHEFLYYMIWVRKSIIRSNEIKNNLREGE